MEIVNNNAADGKEFLRTLASAIDQGQQQPRNYNGKQSLSLPPVARFKMKIWYRDGNSRTYFSYDQVIQQSGSHIDEWEGFKKLMRLGHVHHRQEVKTLVIWATDQETPLTSNASYDYEIFKVTYSGEQRREDVGFRKFGANSVVYRWDVLRTKNKKLG